MVRIAFHAHLIAHYVTPPLVFNVKKAILLILPLPHHVSHVHSRDARYAPRLTLAPLVRLVIIFLVLSASNAAIIVFSVQVILVSLAKMAITHNPLIALLVLIQTAVNAIKINAHNAIKGTTSMMKEFAYNAPLGAYSATLKVALNANPLRYYRMMEPALSVRPPSSLRMVRV